MKFTKFALVLSVVGSVSLFAGCVKDKACCDTGDKTAAARVSVINTMCPIGGDDFGEKTRPAELVRTHNGENIGFCCEGCVKSFDKKADAAKGEVLAAAKANKTL
ncbi:MAG: hypothetical protein ACKVW3_09030 [Phycisphaerales bacterium]